MKKTIFTTISVLVLCLTACVPPSPQRNRPVISPDREELSKLKRENHKLTGERNSYRRQVVDLEKEISQLRARGRKLSELYSVSEDQNNQLQHRVESLAKYIKKLQAEIDSLKKAKTSPQAKPKAKVKPAVKTAPKPGKSAESKIEPKISK